MIVDPESALQVVNGYAKMPYMMPETVTITNVIPIPKNARSSWKNRRAVLFVSDDSIIVKRIDPPSWDELIPKLRAAGKSIPPRVIREAIRWARKQKS